jgi:hypothetical protein
MIVSGPLSVVRRQRLKGRSPKGSSNLPLLTACSLLPAVRCSLYFPILHGLYLECNGPRIRLRRDDVRNVSEMQIKNPAPDRYPLHLLCRVRKVFDTFP